MPLTRVRWQQGRNEGEASIEEFLAMAEADPTFPIPYPVAKTMLEEETDRPKDGLSATALLGGCLSCRVLEREVDFSQNIMDLFYRWKGSMFHLVLERGWPKNSFGEIRFKAEIPGLGPVHGKPDLVVGPWSSATLVDLKTTKSVPMYGSMYNNHEEQLNIYRWLLTHGEPYFEEDIARLPDEVAQGVPLNFTNLVIWYIDPDRIKVIPATISRTVATTSKTAQSPTKQVREPYIWSDEQVEALLVDRYGALVTALQDYAETGKLPAYPPGFDYIGGWEHRYSPVARECVERHIAEKGKVG